MLLQLPETQVVAAIACASQLSGLIGQATDTLRKEALRELRKGVQVLQETSGQVRTPALSTHFSAPTCAPYEMSHSMRCHILRDVTSYEMVTYHMM